MLLPWFACTYSSWLSDNPERLFSFYKINPEKIPDYIYADEDYLDIAYELIKHLGYDYKKTPLNNLYAYK